MSCVYLRHSLSYYTGPPQYHSAPWSLQPRFFFLFSGFGSNIRLTQSYALYCTIVIDSVD